MNKKLVDYIPEGSRKQLLKELIEVMDPKEIKEMLSQDTVSDEVAVADIEEWAKDK